MHEIQKEPTWERKYYKLLDDKDETDIIKLLLDTQFVEGEHFDSIEFSNMVARFSTIPVLDFCDVMVSKESDVFFEILPQQLIFGREATRDSATFIILLRYGIEWQIWYRAFRRTHFRTAISNCAALFTAGVFARYILNGNQNYAPPTSRMQQFLNAAKKACQETEPFPLDCGFFTNPNAVETGIELPEDKLQVIKVLARPTEFMLMQGGDSRLEIATDNMLNKYGCRPFPRAAAFTFSSSTATSVSNQAFNHAERIRQIIIRNAAKMRNEDVILYAIRHLRKKLGLTLGIPSRNHLIFTPSGTDAALLMAGIANAYFQQNDVTHILVCADETGSGVPLALQGKHFADVTHSGIIVEKGTVLEGFSKHRVVAIDSKDPTGSIKEPAQIEAEIELALDKAISNGEKIVLHGMDQSKLGIKAPGQAFLKKVRAKANTQQLLICIDASQLRMGKTAIQDYVNSGCFLIFTGSKFFTAPPFCGALYLPDYVSNKLLTSVQLPPGLKQYSYTTDWPSQFINAPYLKDDYNLGMGLRWECAWFEMERYFLVPEVLRKTGIARFCKAVESMVDTLPYVERLKLPPPNDVLVDLEPEEVEFGHYQTIIPFFILKDGKVLSEAETEKVYRLLNMNLTAYTNKDNIFVRRMAIRECHIGQPVSALYRGEIPGAVVRISLGARVISESWREQDVSLFLKNINSQISQVETIFRKIEWILERMEIFE